MCKKFFQTTTAIALIIGGTILNMKPAYAQGAGNTCKDLGDSCVTKAKHLGPQKNEMFEKGCGIAYTYCVGMVGSTGTPNKEQCAMIQQKCEHLGCNFFTSGCE